MAEQLLRAGVASLDGNQARVSEPRPPVRICSAADLFAGLRHAELAVRLPTLAAVAANPQLVLAYGAYEGVEVVEELCQQLAADAGMLERALFGALSAFADERVLTTSCHLARTHHDPEMVALAIGRLAADSSDLARATLVELLMGEEPARGIQAARALSRREDLSWQEKVRIDLWIGFPDKSPGDPACRDFWHKELAGPLQARARRCLEDQGLPAFVWLVDSLPPDAWLLAWGAAQFPQAALPLLEQALQGELADQALEIIAEQPERFPSLAAASEPFLSSCQAHRRALAWKLAPLSPSFDWKTALQVEDDPEVRRALAQRMARQCLDEESLLRLASDKDWKIRAFGSEGLIRLGALESARPLALSANVETRAVGAAVLVALEDYEWMEEHLLT